MTNPTLMYFPLGGRAELARLCFHAGNVPFEDQRVDFNEFFTKIKPTLPLGQVPVLNVEGTTIVQSMAIARYAAKQAKLYPTDPLQSAQVDMIVDTLMDILDGIIDVVYHIKDEKLKEESKNKLIEERIPKILQGVTGFICQNGCYFVADQLSMADIFLMNVADEISELFPTFDMGKDFPQLAQIVKSVRELPQLQAYLTSEERCGEKK